MSNDTKNRIRALLQSGRMEDAKKLCHSFCKKNRNDAEAWFMLGTIYGQANELKNATDSLLKSISLQSNIAITHHNLGLIYLRSGKPELARHSFVKALNLAPDSMTTRQELANALQAAGSPYDAIPIYESILESSPDSIPTLTNLASAYTASGLHAQAIHSYRRLLELQGNSPETLFLLGNTYRSAGMPGDAETVYRSALEINPHLSGALNNLGLALYEQAMYKDAERCFRRSLDIEQRQSDAYINLAKCLQEQRELSAAKTVLEKALVFHPEKPEIHWDFSLILLKLGQFEDGWKEYEWRLKGEGLVFRSAPLPVWHGEDISTKTILVTAEQGIGDEIMFSSCFQDLARLAAHVVIDCEYRLAPLFNRSFPECVIRPDKHADSPVQTSSFSGIDVYISAGSIPQYLRKHLCDFPRLEGYLSANPAMIEKWRTRYRALDKNMNVGISWRGGHISRKKQRSSSIKDWLQVLKVPGINFINMQYGDIQADIELARTISGTSIYHWQDSDPLKNMDDFAAQISALDLVIAVDNSTVHLAGALGIETWVLQPYNPDWRWLQDADDSYWYPSILQFHPSAHGEWRRMIDSIAVRLHDFIESL